MPFIAFMASATLLEEFAKRASIIAEYALVRSASAAAVFPARARISDTSNMPVIALLARCIISPPN